MPLVLGILVFGGLVFGVLAACYFGARLLGALADLAEDWAED